MSEIDGKANDNFDEGGVTIEDEQECRAGETSPPDEANLAAKSKEVVEDQDSCRT